MRASQVPLSGSLRNTCEIQVWSQVHFEVSHEWQEPNLASAGLLLECLHAKVCSLELTPSLPKGERGTPRSQVN